MSFELEVQPGGSTPYNGLYEEARLERSTFIRPQVLLVFTYDAKKIQTTKLSILPRFYFHDALEQLKSNFHTNLHFKRVLGFVIE